LEVLRDDNTPAAVGEVGRVVITDYFNDRCPLIRYELGDYVVREPCPCGQIKLPGMRRYQVIQHSVERFTVKVISDQTIDADITQAIRKHFGYVPQRLTIRYVDDIPLGPNGKFFATISEV
jgi:hypothetical protein